MMLHFDVPGLGRHLLSHLVLDFTGTHFVEGDLIPGAADALRATASILTLYVLTVDTMAGAREALAGLPCTLRILEDPGILRSL